MGLTALVRGVNFEILSVFILLVTYEQEIERRQLRSLFKFYCKMRQQEGTALEIK